MNKPDSQPASLTMPPASQSDLSTRSGKRLGHARRLIVLVPDVESDYIPAIRKIWELANAQHARIRFLGLSKDVAKEPCLHRQLVTMSALSALVGGDEVSTEVKVEIGTNWVDVVKRNSQTGDMIICFEEQRAGLLHRPLSQILEASLNFPVYILSGLYAQKSKSNWLSEVIVWSGFIGIIICFAILQVKIVQLPKDWFQDVLFILSLIPEFWLILVWNNLFG